VGGGFDLPSATRCILTESMFWAAVAAVASKHITVTSLRQRGIKVGYLHRGRGRQEQYG